MPARWRIACVFGGGVLLALGWLLGENTLMYDFVSPLELIGPALLAGVGVGLLATAFLPRD